MSKRYARINNIPQLEKKLVKVWSELLQYAKDSNSLVDIAKLFDDMLDNLAADDYFGTEGQCDPRGDARDNGMRSVFDDLDRIL